MRCLSFLDRVAFSHEKSSGLRTIAPTGTPRYGSLFVDSPTLGQKDSVCRLQNQHESS